MAAGPTGLEGTWRGRLSGADTWLHSVKSGGTFPGAAGRRCAHTRHSGGATTGSDPPARGDLGRVHVGEAELGAGPREARPLTASAHGGTLWSPHAALWGTVRTLALRV